MAIGVINDTLLTNIAEAIRSKNLQETTYLPSEMPAAIEAIETGIDTSDATATAEDMAEGVTAYVNGEKITGNVPHKDRTYGQEPVLTEDNKVSLYYSASFEKRMVGGGKRLTITSALSNFGDAQLDYVLPGFKFTSSAGLNVTGEMPVIQEETYIPSTDDQTIIGGCFMNGDQTIKGDSNLVPGNIKRGISIFGVDGIYNGPEKIYKWDEYTVEKSVVKTEKTNWILVSSMPVALKTGYIDYSSTYSISNGNIVLDSPTRIQPISTDVDWSVLPGKYIYTSHNDSYYFIPSNATVSYQTQTGAYNPSLNQTYYIASSAELLTYEDSKGSFVASVTSSDSAAYPENGIQNSKWYVFTGSEGGGEDITNMHIWKKYTIVDDTYIETEVEDYPVASVAGSSSTVKYANEISVLDNDISLIDGQTITFTVDDDVDTTLSVIKGKYVGTDIVGYAFIPSDASLYITANGTYRTLLASKAIKIEANTSALNPELLGYVGSNVDTTYPINGEQNGYTYVYVGVLSDCIVAE